MEKLRMGLILTFASLAILVSGCSDVNFTDVSKAKRLGDPPTDPPPTDPPPVFTPPCPEAGCEESFNYTPNVLNPKLDLLFVVDTSGSLNQERDAVAQGLSNYIAALEADSPNVDFNVAVALAHGPQSSWSGKFYVEGSEPAVLKKSAHSISDIKRWLKNKLNNISSDSSTDGGEVGLYATNKLLEAAPLANAQSKGMFRPQATLAIVYVADENDICALYPNGVTPVYDPEKKEGPAKAAYCGGISALSVYSKLVALKGGINKVLVASVIYTGANAVPQSGENEIGYGYNTMVANAGPRGRLVDIASNNIQGGMADFGDLSGSVVSPSTFVLAHPNADEEALGLSIKISSLQVKVERGAGMISLSAANGDFIFDATNNAVIVNVTLQVGDKIHIIYDLE